MSEQKELKKRLKALMALPENQVCSDCTERQPRWASLIVPPPGAPEGSLPIGAFCCLECSGSHRRLGVHISFVRSINLDSWKEREVLAMENGGNAKVNAIFEANLTRDKPTNHADLQTRERYIRDKYERRKFYTPSAFATYRAAPRAPPPPTKSSSSLSASQPKEIALPALATPSPAGPPSDVAQRRIQERRRRNQGLAKEGSSDRSLRRIGSSDDMKKMKKKAPSSRKVKAHNSGSSVDLLDFNEAPPAPAPAAATDLFGFLEGPSAATADTPSETFGNSFVANGSSSGKNKSAAAADIMALYASNGSMQTQGFGIGGGGGHNGMHMAGMNGMTNQMGQMNLGHHGGGGGGMWSPQQQQKQQMMMMQQQQMMMMMQQSNFNPQMMNGNMNPQMMNGNMMMQQQQHRQAQQNHGFGGQMNPMGGQAASTATTQKEDPFASLGGRNTFR